MTNWTDIGALSDIPRRSGRVIRTAHGCIAVFRNHKDKVFAIDDACPHRKGPLSEGIVHGSAVTCPLHNRVIDLATGKARGADQGRVATYQVKVSRNRIFINLSRLSATTAA